MPTRTRDCLRKMKNITHLTLDLLGTLAFHNSVGPIEYKLSEMVDLMAFPVRDAS